MDIQSSEISPTGNLSDKTPSEGEQIKPEEVVFNQPTEEAVTAGARTSVLGPLKRFLPGRPLQAVGQQLTPEPKTPTEVIGEPNKKAEQNQLFGQGLEVMRRIFHASKSAQARDTSDPDFNWLKWNVLKDELGDRNRLYFIKNVSPFLSRGQVEDLVMSAIKKYPSLAPQLKP